MASTLHAQVAILGAGPAGTAMALRLAQLGLTDVALLDAHDFPRDKTCGSGLSPRGIQALRDLGVYDRVAPHAYSIDGLRLVTPRGRDVVLRAGIDQAAVVCLRRHLDHALLGAATERGVRFVPHFKAKALLEEGGRTVGVVDASGREVRARWVAVANGAHSRFTLDESPRKTIHAIMGWWEGVPFQKGLVEMLFVPEVAPYYGWLFPESDARVNIGICYPEAPHTRNARELFQRFLDAHYAERLRDARETSPRRGHPIVYTYRIEKLWSPGRVVLGEAARLTNPATGEGISQGYRSGIFAAEAAHRHLVDGATEESALRAYERRCQREFLPSQYAGGLFKRSLSTPLLDWATSFTQLPAVQRLSARVLSHL